MWCPPQIKQKLRKECFSPGALTADRASCCKRLESSVPLSCRTISICTPR